MIDIIHTVYSVESVSMKRNFKDTTKPQGIIICTESNVLETNDNKCTT